MDRWIAATLGSQLGATADPLVIDLGFGASPVTTVELADRLRAVQPEVRVLGLEIDPERVELAARFARPPRLEFARGGFEFAGHRPLLVRAANVLRQYDEGVAALAWTTMCANLGPEGVLVEGTCDELGRRAAWVLLDAGGPRTFTLASRLAELSRPSTLAARLPKALIHHNVPGQAIHRLLGDLDAAWDAAAPLRTFGPRQRWMAACERVAIDWPVLDGKTRWRQGELTLQWSAVAPT
jgi:hypothetical protein